MNTLNTTFIWLREFSPEPATSIPEAKATLKGRGWSYRKAAPVLGVGYVHLCRVLNGQRDSRRLLAAIANLPQAPNQKGNP